MDTSKVGRIFVGETEEPLPAPKNDYQLSCALRHKVGEIDPRYCLRAKSTIKMRPIMDRYI